MTFERVLSLWDWRPIPGCPGRHKLPRSTLSPAEIVDADLPVERHLVSGTKDPVLVVRLDDGGLISYEQQDGSFVHTLGDADGLARKLQRLGL